MKIALLTAALLMTFAMTALAQDAPDFSPEQLGGDKKPQRPQNLQAVIPAGLLYASFDTDGDYAVSRPELNAGILRSFARADTSGNERVSLVELDVWREVILGSRDRLPGNTQFDKNFDSQIDPSEFGAVLTGLFESFDRNDNGALEFSEMTRDIRRQKQNSSRKRERAPLFPSQSRRRQGY